MRIDQFILNAPGWSSLTRSLYLTELRTGISICENILPTVEWGPTLSAKHTDRPAFAGRSVCCYLIKEVFRRDRTQAWRRSNSVKRRFWARIRISPAGSYPHMICDPHRKFRLIANLAVIGNGSVKNCHFTFVNDRQELFCTVHVLES